MPSVSQWPGRDSATQDWWLIFGIWYFKGGIVIVIQVCYWYCIDAFWCWCKHRLGWWQCSDREGTWPLRTVDSQLGPFAALDLSQVEQLCVWKILTVHKSQKSLITTKNSRLVKANLLHLQLKWNNCIRENINKYFNKYLQLYWLNNIANLLTNICKYLQLKWNSRILENINN